MSTDQLSVEELIARLGAATEGSQELDAFVVSHVVDGEVHQSPFNGRWCIYSGTDRSGNPRLWNPSGDYECHVCGARIVDTVGPTRSLDVALTLIPDGWVIPSNHGLHQSITDGEWFWGCALARLATHGHGWVYLDWKTTRPKTPALALCIVALKARINSNKD